MPAGYDKRTKFSDRYDSEAWNASGLRVKGVRGLLKKSEVISYRDNPQGTPLDPKAVDPYHGHFNRNTAFADYLNPGPRLRAQLEAAGLAEDSDYQNQAGFEDNGHPFSLSRTEWKYSAIGPRKYRNPVQNPGDPQFSGSGFCVNNMIVSSSGVSKLLWDLPSGPSGSTRRWNVSNPGIFPAWPTDQLQSDGTRMLSLVAPGKPPVDLVATTGELFAGIPRLPGSALLSGGIIPGVGGEYLNFVFGLLPTHGDAVDVAEAMKTVSVRLLQLKRDAGRPVRRKMALPITQRSAILSGSDLWSGAENSTCGLVTDSSTFGYNRAWTSAPISHGTEYTVRTAEAIPTLFMRETRKVWFSGSFTYQIPTIPGLSGKLENWLSEYDRLLGLSANASNAWQLAPWSWLIDWFLDIRQNLDAISVAHDDNLVVNYGYAMEQFERSMIAKLQFTGGTGISGNPFVHTMITQSSKRRIRANPYGFVREQDSNQWSAYRLAVLSALGITKI